MKMITMNSAGRKLAIFFVIAFFTGAFASWAHAWVLAKPIAVVEAARGDANVTAAGSSKSVRLAVGRMIDVSDTIHTPKHAKVFLRWDTGLLMSLGTRSTMSVEQREAPDRTVNVMSVTHGLLRVTKLSGGGNVTPYEVKTPDAVIEPVDYDKPLDFIVDASSPTKTMVTVLGGRVRLKALAGSHPSETVVQSCHVGYVDRGKLLPVAPATKAHNILRLLDNATIPGTVGTWFACPVPAWRYRAASGTVAVPSRSTRFGT